MLRSTDTPSFISATEAALRLGVSAETVRKHCRTGTYPAERRNTPYGPAWFVDVSALPAQPVPDVTPNIAENAPDALPSSDAVVTALMAHNDDLRGQLDIMRAMIADKDKSHAAEVARLVDAHSREVATLRDVNRDQYAILERLSVPRLPDSQPAAPRPWWRVW